MSQMESQPCLSVGIMAVPWDRVRTTSAVTVFMQLPLPLISCLTSGVVFPHFLSTSCSNPRHRHGEQNAGLYWGYMGPIFQVSITQGCIPLSACNLHNSELASFKWHVKISSLWPFCRTSGQRLPRAGVLSGVLHALR